MFSNKNSLIAELGEYQPIANILTHVTIHMKIIFFQLYLLSCVIVTSSSCVLYMYGYQKFMSYVESEREKHSILIREGRTTLWSYFAHCSAMCVLIALAVCNGPLLYDYTLIYKGSLDGTVLVQFNKVFLICKIMFFKSVSYLSIWIDSKSFVWDSA